ncbi:MAG TPA: hypothetical protein VGA95_14805 [Thermodesulfobacteriota bacterium]
MSIKNQIIEAIKSGYKVELNYKGEGNRLVHPHALYRDKTSGTLKVDCYQEAGFSTKPHEIPNWRQFDINLITSLRLLNESFTVASVYNPSSERYSNAIAMIK